MTHDLRDLAHVRRVVLVLCGTAWMWLLADPSGLTRLPHGPVTGARDLPLSASLPNLLAMHPPASLAAGWGLMLVAMMSPALVLPVSYIRLRSFNRRRVRATALFVAGYGATWMAAGCVLVAGGLTLGLLAPNSLVLVGGGLLLAIVWEVSPAKQRCLNRCHAHSGLAAFGFAADLDAFRFGVSHGAWCSGSCWAMMLTPMLLPRGHLTAMAVVTVLSFGEKLEHPKPPRWRWRGFGKLSRSAVARTRIGLARLKH